MGHNKSELHKLQSQPRLESSAVYIGQGWILAGGDKTKADQLLKALGLFVDVPQRHQSALMIGNDESGWFRISSWAPTEKLVGFVDTLAAGKNAGGVGSALR